MFQIKNDSQLETLMIFMETALEIIFISISIFTILITPILLFYFAFNNYFKWQESKKLIDRHLCCDKDKCYTTYASKICNQYRKYFTRLISNTLGLIAWNLFSIIYIITSFSNFKFGVYDYFLFPFKVLESYSLNYSINNIYQFKSQGISMLIIFILSLLFFHFGKHISHLLLKNNSSLSYNYKSLTSNSKIKITPS